MRKWFHWLGVHDWGVWVTCSKDDCYQFRTCKKCLLKDRRYTGETEYVSSEYY